MEWFFKTLRKKWKITMLEPQINTNIIGKIREAKIEDAGRMAEIQFNGWRTAYRGIISDDFLFGRMNIKKKIANFEKEIEEFKNQFYIYERNNIICGMMIISECKDEDRKDAFELLCLYTDFYIWREGIGNQLLSYCEKEAINRGFSKNVLWCLDKNNIGRGFYEKNGYRLDNKSQIIEKFGVVELRYVKYL